MVMPFFACRVLWTLYVLHRFFNQITKDFVQAKWLLRQLNNMKYDSVLCQAIHMFMKYEYTYSFCSILPKYLTTTRDTALRNSVKNNGQVDQWYENKSNPRYFHSSPNNYVKLSSSMISRRHLFWNFIEPRIFRLPKIEKQ